MISRLIRASPTVVLMVLCIVIFGVLSYATLPRESAPDIKVPYILVSTPYIGVSPADVESLITNPIENELSGIKDLKQMSSTSAEGVSIVFLEFEPEVVIEDAIQRVRDRVNRAKTDLPEDAEEPEVREISFSDFPILLVTIAGGSDEQKLKQLGEELQDEIGRIKGVLEVTLTGGLERQFRVQVDPVRMGHYGLSLDDLMGAIGNENVNMPGGDVSAGTASYLLRVPGDFTNAADIEQVAITRVGDRPVFVRDVARVIDGFEDRAGYARMNGEAAVSLQVKKRSGANIVRVAEKVKELTATRAEAWPEGVTYEVLSDQSKEIKDMVSELENNIITALLLVIAVIMFFMGVRPSVFVALAIPMSMLLSFVVIQALGITLNMVVLFSLILALGMLVDNAIVIVENIYRHVEMGKSLVDASIDGTNEVALAVAASTATTVVAFLPLVFWGGIMGQFMSFLPKTVIIVLISSLVVAVTFLPVATSAMLRRPRVKEGAENDKAQHPLMRGYQNLLEWSIDHRWVSVIGGFAMLFGTFVVYGQLQHGLEFFPETDPRQGIIAIRAPDGTELETTDRIVRQLEAMLAQVENVDLYVAETGVSGSGDPLVGAQSLPNEAKITVDFLQDRNNVLPGEKVRVESTFLTIETMRAMAMQLPGAEITVEKQEMGPPVGSPISVQVAGDDFHEVGKAAQKIRRDLAKIEGTADLKDDYKVGRPEMRLRIDRGAVKRIGANTNDVARTLRTSNAGAVAGAIRDGEDEYDIVVEVDPRFRQNLQDILNLRIPGRDDQESGIFPVPLSTVASYELAGGSGSIRHLDQELVVTITGDVTEGANSNAIRTEIQAYIDDWGNKDGIVLSQGGEDDEMNDAIGFMLPAFAAALFMILIVLVTQFNSFAMPFIIMATVLLSLIGVLWGLIITGTPFGVIMTGIGVISLAGVVVNNAIVLLDYVEQLRKRKLETRDALVEAGLTRFRPVMLTAITTILGLVPMAIGLSIDFKRFKFIIGGDSAGMWGGMANAVIFGLAFATILTLVMVPTLYSIYDDLMKGRLFAGFVESFRFRKGKKAPKEAESSGATGGLQPQPAGRVAEQPSAG